jgi:mono/diheme cytochrome c family protein
MKTFTVVIILAVAATMLAAPALAADGAATFKAKCAACHGPAGEGKPAMKAPALKGTSLDEAAITNVLVKGDAAKKAPHNAAFKALTADDAKAIATFVKTLK